MSNYLLKHTDGVLKVCIGIHDAAADFSVICQKISSIPKRKRLFAGIFQSQQKLVDNLKKHFEQLFSPFQVFSSNFVLFPFRF